MRLVVADTSPINYLILIGKIELLPQLFARITLPAAVCNELLSPRAPIPVRAWIGAPPSWLEISSESFEYTTDEALAGIDKGERDAIQLAALLEADLILIDDRKGVRAAEERGFLVLGTLGVLDLAAEAGFVDLKQAIRALEQTSFRRPRKIVEYLLAKHGGWL